jgi:hypothetical protein
VHCATKPSVAQACASPASLKQVLYVHSALTLALLVVPRAGLGPEHSISSHSGVSEQVGGLRAGGRLNICMGCGRKISSTRVTGRLHCPYNSLNLRCAAVLKCPLATLTHLMVYKAGLSPSPSPFGPAPLGQARTNQPGFVSKPTTICYNHYMTLNICHF